MRPWMNIAMGLLALIVMMSCDPCAPPPPANLPLRVELSGCFSFRKDRVCEVPPDRILNLWVAEPNPGLISVHVDARTLEVSSAAVQRGSLLRVNIPVPARQLIVRVRSSTVARTKIWQLGLEERGDDPKLTHAAELRAAGKYDEARAELQLLLAGAASPAVKAIATGRLGRIELAQGKADAASALLRGAIELHRTQGRVSDQAFDMEPLIYGLIYSGRRFDEVAAVLEQMKALGDDYAPIPVTHEYFEGLLHFETGDIRSALAHFRDASTRAERIAHRIRFDAVQMEAQALQIIGRESEADSRMRIAIESLDGNRDPCGRADVLVNLGWLRLLSMESELGRRYPGLTATQPLEEAIALHRTTCPKPAKLANALTNLALARLHDGDLVRAREKLNEAQQSQPDADVLVRSWWSEIEGRIAFQGGAYEDAAEAYARQVRESVEGSLAEAEWRGQLGLARSLVAMRQPSLARAAFERAEALLDDQTLAVPLGEGREMFLSRGEVTSRLHVDFLLEHGTPAEAAATARKSRRRLLSALAWMDRVAMLDSGERARWDAALSVYWHARDALAAGTNQANDPFGQSRSKNAEARRKLLADAQRALDSAFALVGADSARSSRSARPEPPKDGELFLIYHPVAGAWAGFAATNRQTIARRIEVQSFELPPAELSSALLGPFSNEISAARSILVMAYGSSARVDFAALPWHGKPLIARAPIAHKIDLGGRGELREGGAERRALIVADPRNDLPGAQREANAVAAALIEDRWAVERIEGEGATFSAVRAALRHGNLDLFHYAGHGVYEGLDGLKSRLPLADSGWLQAADIVALGRVPRVVVLSACEGARTSDFSGAEGLGLAQAFLLGGAEEVLAATRPVNDRVAEKLIEQMYRVQGRTSSMMQALQQAELAVLEKTPNVDWASFRIYVH